MTSINDVIKVCSQVQNYLLVISLDVNVV